MSKKITEFRTDSADQEVVERFDTFRLDLAPGNIDKYIDSVTGFLTVPARIARADNIQSYYRGAVEVFEFRPAEEVFHDDAIKSFNLKPITIGHPAELVTSRNIKNYQIGMTGNDARRDGDFLSVTMSITDSIAIQDVRERHALGRGIEVSAGYNVVLDKTPGVFNGQRYDQVQRRIKGNHVGLVHEGNAGADVRLRIDQARGALPENKGGNTMDFLFNLIKVGTFRADQITTKIEAAAQAGARAIQTRLDELASFANGLISTNEKLTEVLSTRTDELTKARADLVTRTDELEKIKPLADPAHIGLLVDERVDVLAACQDLGIEVTRDDGKVNIGTLELMRNVINKVSGERFRVDDKLADESLRQRFIGVQSLVTRKDKDNQRGAFNTFLDGARGDKASDNDKPTVRQDFAAKQTKLWKKTATQILAGPGEGGSN